MEREKREESMSGSLNASLAGSMISKGAVEGPWINSSSMYINICCIGSLFFGYGISCMNCMKKTMATEFGWEERTLTNNFSTLSTAVYVGAAVGAFCGGVLSTFGRRTLNQTLHVCFIIGGVVCCFANGLWMLLIGRLVMGYAVGLVTVASPMIISEISPLQTRGSNGVRHQLFITIGILVGLGLGSPLNMEDLSISHSTYMRFMLALPAITSSIVLVLITFWLTAETPTFLISSGKPEEARQMLRQIYQKRNVEAEFEALSAGQRAADAETMSLWRALRDPWYRKALLIGVFLAVGQQFCGINAFVSLSNSIFENAGITGSHLSLANTVMSIVNVLATFPAIYVIEAFGRRPLYIWGNAGQTLFLSLVPLAILVPFFSAQLPVVSVVSVVGFIICFAMSNGPILWVYINEIFPPEIQGAACGLCAATNWIAGIAIVFAVSQFEDPKYTLFTFSFFAIASLVIFFFCVAFVKETKGRANADSPYMEGRRQKGEAQPLVKGNSSEKYV